MGLLRWLLWPRRTKSEEDEEPEKRARRKGKTRAKARSRDDDGVYRIEVDSEPSHFRRDGPAFSFWSSSRIILILALLLWWVQPAGPMIAGYVGGRRAGAPWKAVLAALLPVFVILVANQAYAHNVAAQQIDFVASFPRVVGDGVASLLPFLAPYRDFLITYIQGFVEALRVTFGMGTNGYLMVIVFAYIGGLIAEQTRRELAYRSGASTSVGVNLVQPLLHRRAREDDVDDGEYDDEDAPARHRRPVRARSPIVAGRRRRSRRGAPESFEEYRRLPAEAVGSRGERRSARARRDHVEDEEPEDEAGDEDEAPVRHRRPAPGRAARSRESARAEPKEEPAAREVREKRSPRPRSHEEEVAIQRFVERALRNYDRAKL